MRRIGRPRLGIQAIVDRSPTHEVTRIGDEEDPGRFPTKAIWNDVKALYRTGLHPAIALHVRHRGRVVMDRTIGHVRNAPGERPGPIATPDTLFSLFSASKIVTASLVLALVEDGVLSLDAPVVGWLPELDRHGKHRITLRNLLQHTAGIPDMPPLPDLEGALATGEVDLELLADLVPKTAPGTRVAYHALTMGFIVHALVERATGRPIREVLRERLLDPLGLTHMAYGVDPSLVDEVARHAVTGPPVPPFMASIFERSIGLDLDTAVGITNRPEFLTGVVPSANVIAPAREVSAFVQMLLEGGTFGGVRVLDRRTVAAMQEDVTPLQLDGTFNLPIRYGLGVMMGHDTLSLFGAGTAGAFGHLGLSSVVVWADPARDLAVAFLNTGKPMMAPGMVTWYRVLQSIASRVPRS
jgi:CubicO group peptidase (beta-lactamase class C family)